jgi:hypothetical protein
VALWSLPALAALTPVSQTRAVATFAVITMEGEDPFCSDQIAVDDPGVFVETVTCHLEVDGNEAMGTASQLSYVTPELILAEGSFQAHSDVSGGSEFAEALGVSRFVSVFSVDTRTDIHLQALIHADGNGTANLVFRVENGEIFVYRSIQTDSETVDQVFSLEPGSYELTLSTSGYGQAFPGGGNPAFGSFSASIILPAAGIAASEPAAHGIHGVPVVAPNPVHERTRLMPAPGNGAAQRELWVLDLSGRLIRHFAGVGPAGVSWDTRDASGRLVPAGIYLVRGASGGAGRAIVLRP